jgi:apolipoprotein D and lipocalin family protein
VYDALGMNRTFPLRAVLFAVALATIGCTAEAPLEVAPMVDLNRFQGKWYEVASLPRETQASCYGTTSFYSQASDGSFQFVNQCNVESGTGPVRTVTMKATVPDKSVPAKLAIDVGGFSGDYWILDVGADYEYAVVGHPTRLYLWIMSRTPTLDSDTLQGILDRAQSKRFDTSKLQYTPQPPPIERASSPTPVGPVPAASNGGCAASNARGHDQQAWWLGLVVAAIVGARRVRRTSAPSKTSGYFTALSIRDRRAKTSC